MVGVQEYHLKILAPGKTDEVFQVLVSSHPHPRINVGDQVENMVLDKAKLPANARALIVTCVHHSLDTHFGNTIMTTRLETAAKRYD